MTTLDTNVVLYALKGSLAQPLPRDQYCVSVVTELELLSFPAITSAEEAIIKSFLAKTLVQPLDEQVKSKAIDIRRAHRLRLPDAIVAATAVVRGTNF